MPDTTPQRHVVNYRQDERWKQEEYETLSAASKRTLELKMSGHKETYCVTFPTGYKT